MTSIAATPPSADDARAELRRLFEVLAADPSAFLTEWNAKRHEHLPWSLSVLRDPQVSVHQAADIPPAGIARVVWDAHRRYVQSKHPQKTLLLVTGFSFEQVVLSMALHVTAFGCRRVLPVSTNYAWQQSGRGEDIRQWWNVLRATIVELPPWDDLVVIDDSGLPLLDVKELSPNDVFRRVRAWLKTNRQLLGHVAIDATGGTKPMDSGASACAAFYNLPAYYIHTAEYHSTLRRPLPHSATYSLLDRPSATFSQHSRESIWHAFESRDLVLAGELTRQLSAEIGENGEYHAYFDDEDRACCDVLARLIRDSHDWLTIGYRTACANRVEGSSGDANDAAGVHAPADRISNAQDIEVFLRRHAAALTNPRDIIGAMRKLSREADGWKLSMEYFVSEYYRLCFLLNRDPPAIHGPRNGEAPSPPTENIREVLTVGYGLAESVLDAMLNLPACRLRMHVQWKGQQPDVAARDEAIWDRFLEWGWIAPDPEFFHLQYDKKIGLLCGGQTFERVRAIRRQAPNDLPDGALRSLVEQLAADGRFPVLRGSPPLQRADSVETSVKIRLRTSHTIKTKAPLLAGGDQAAWATWLGIPERRWTDVRNAITHVRVPVTEEMRNIALLAVSRYLPRLIELYRRLGEVPVDRGGNELAAGGQADRLPIDLNAVELYNWVTWVTEDQWKPSRLVPWDGRGATVRRWLGLELAEELT